jgi:hypothetical protein
LCDLPDDMARVLCVVTTMGEVDDLVKAGRV